MMMNSVSRFKPLSLLACSVLALFVPGLAHASEIISLGPIPVDFILFALTLLGVALFHDHTLKVALTGLVTITLYKLLFTGFHAGAGFAGLGAHFTHEWVTLSNLFFLLMGFALLARHFEKTHIPVKLPSILPNDWKGAFLMLVLVFVMSAFLDNIAAALIGGAMAHQLFRAKIHVGYLAAIVAASNAGGSGSVLGDTTTTMMWIDGVSPLDVIHAYAGAITALVVFGIPASLQQHRYSPILKHSHQHTHIDWKRAGIVFTILIAAVVANVASNVVFPGLAGRLPLLGLAVWVVLLLSMGIRRPDWEVLPETFKGTIFLLSLVSCASMMPVEKLPAASQLTVFGLGFVSAVFDNIPLTALALKQGGYDWGSLAYAVGFGGSMLWFGSSAGVALASQYPEAKSVSQWLKHGWHVALGYVVGFIVLALVMGWNPHAPHKAVAAPAAVSAQH